MGRRVWIFIGLIWTALVVGTGIYLAQDYQPGQDYTVYNRSCRNVSDIYVAENRTEGALLYRIASDGKVKAIYDTQEREAAEQIAGISYREGLYVLLQSRKQENGQTVTVYQIVRMNSSLKQKASSPELTLDTSGVLSDFYMGQDTFYLTLLSRDGKQVDVYQAERGIVTEGSGEDEEEAEKTAGLRLKSIQTQECQAGRFFVEAGWNDKGLRLRTDTGMEEDDRQELAEIKKAYEGKRLTLLQRVVLAREPLTISMVVLVIGYALLWALAMLLKHRNRIIYMAFIMEAALLAIALTGAGLIHSSQKNMQIREYSHFGFYAMENLLSQTGGLKLYSFEDADFYENEDYYSLQNDLAETVMHSGSKQIFYDLCVVRIKDQVIVASASGRNGYHVETVYTDAAKKLVQQMTMPEEEAISEMELQGQKYGLLVLADSQGFSPEYVLLGVTRQESLTADIPTDRNGIAAMIVIFLAGSVFCFFILWIQSEDLRRLGNAMQAVATGKEDVELHRSMVLGNDMNVMWNSLYEVNKTIKRVYYSKYLMFEAYYRFAPKQIEKILNKDSITEVKSGDAIRLNGTIAMISTKQTRRIDLGAGQKDGQVDLEDMNRLLALIASYQEDEKGILISGDGTLSMMRMLFLKGGNDTIDFGIEFGHMLEEDGGNQMTEASVLLHSTDVLYGIAGVKEQSMPFLLSEEIKELEQHVEWLRDMGLRLVMTDSVKSADDESFQVRYIGYFEIEAAPEKIRLYEVLDVCPEKERSRKLSYDEKFQQAIRLFYQNDFYLARSAFTEIVKESPEDRIAKWYLFTCEKYLNEAHTEAVSCKLNQ